MHLNKRFAMLAPAAAAAALVIAPGTASAATGECVFQGVAGNISPGVVLVGGSGVYDFSTTNPQTTQCNFETQGPKPSKIFSRGSFVNTVCGTGTAQSQQGVPSKDPQGDDTTTVDYGNDGSNEISSARYTIQFRGAQGQLDIETVNGSPDQLAVNGHVTIIPAQGEQCSDEDDPANDNDDGVNTFEVAGAFVARW
jgi:hypothetical protein